MNDLTNDIIRYDVLAQDALRGLVRKVLAEVEKTGTLPGEHHFYITFDTNAQGVRISNAIKERYPEEMTIIIQHQFWDLKVSETRFEVGLSFSDVAETLSIPFGAITGFVDPSVKFVLQFDAEGDVEDEPLDMVADIAEVHLGDEVLNGASNEKLNEKSNEKLPVKKKDKLPVKKAKKAELALDKETSDLDQDAHEAVKNTKKTAGVDELGATKSADEADGDGADGDDNVVSLDAFRKK